jgi:hypothetical protein
MSDIGREKSIADHLESFDQGKKDIRRTLSA